MCVFVISLQFNQENGKSYGIGTSDIVSTNLWRSQSAIFY